MELKINTKENPLLKRKEITGEITFTGATPSNKKVQEELAKKLGAKPELVAIRHIYGAYGGEKATLEAYVYETKEQFDKVEPKKKEKPAAPGEAPAETPAPAAPAEKKEEKPAEKKEEKPAAPEEKAPKEEKPAEPAEKAKAEEAKEA